MTLLLLNYRDALSVQLLTCQVILATTLLLERIKLMCLMFQLNFVSFDVIHKATRSIVCYTKSAALLFIKTV